MIRPCAYLRANNILLDGSIHLSTPFQWNDIQIDLLQHLGDLLHLKVMISPADNASFIWIERLKGIFRKTNGLDLGTELQGPFQFHQGNVELLFALVERVHKDGLHFVYLKLTNVDGTDAYAVVRGDEGAEEEGLSLEKEVIFSTFNTNLCVLWAAVRIHRLEMMTAPPKGFESLIKSAAKG